MSQKTPGEEKTVCLKCVINDKGNKKNCCIKQIRGMRDGRILHFDPKSRGRGIEEGEVLHLFAPKLRKWEL